MEKGGLKVVFLPPDVEKRENPVCHFATPLDASMDFDVHRPAEVKAEQCHYYVVHKQKLCCFLSLKSSHGSFYIHSLKHSTLSLSFMFPL